MRGEGWGGSPTCSTTVKKVSGYMSILSSHEPKFKVNISRQYIIIISILARTQRACIWRASAPRSHPLHHDRQPMGHKRNKQRPPADSKKARAAEHADNALRRARHKQRRMKRKGDRQTLGDLDGSQGRGIRIEIPQTELAMRGSGGVAFRRGYDSCVDPFVLRRSVLYCNLHDLVTPTLKNTS